MMYVTSPNTYLFLYIWKSTINKSEAGTEVLVGGIVVSTAGAGATSQVGVCFISR
jgi:hypothetical protein